MSKEKVQDSETKSTAIVKKLDFSLLSVGDLVYFRYQGTVNFSVLVLRFIDPDLFEGLIMGHDAPMLNNRPQKFHSSARLFHEEEWTFDIVPGHAKDTK